MAQLDVYRNIRSSRTDIPFLLDVQSDLVALATRVVIPLVPRQRFGKVISRLNPVVAIESKDMVLSTADIASLPVRQLGPVVNHVGSDRDRIMAAIDFLLRGI